MSRSLLRVLLDAVRDDAYELPELWSIAREPGLSEETSRRRTRDTFLELNRLGYVRFLRKPEPGMADELTALEVEALRQSDSAWGLGAMSDPSVLVTTTPAGDTALDDGALD